MTQWDYSYSVSVRGGKRIAEISDITVSMPVISEYAAKEYRVDVMSLVVRVAAGVFTGGERIVMCLMRFDGCIVCKWVL